MRKRGIYVAGAGCVMLLTSFAIVATVLPDPSALDNKTLVSDLFGKVFDHVTGSEVVYPGERWTFSYTPQDPAVPLLWGVQITDYQGGDMIEARVTDIYGTQHARIMTSDPAYFDVMDPGEASSYDFEIQNRGPRPLAAQMMFTEDPENSEFLSDPDSPLVSFILPLAAAGIAAIAGAVTAVLGGIIFVLDIKRAREGF